MESLLALITDAEAEPCSHELAREAVSYLVEVLPAGGTAINPTMFLEAAALSLVGVPADIVIRMIHPGTGITRTAKWLPGLSEIAGFCDAEIDRRKLAKAAARRRLAELDRRDALSRDRWIAAPDVEKAKQPDTWSTLALPKIGGSDG